MSTTPDEDRRSYVPFVIFISLLTVISNGASPQPDEACGSHVTLLGAPVGQDDP